MKTYTEINQEIEEVLKEIQSAYTAHISIAWKYVRQAELKLKTLQDEVKLNIKTPKNDTLEKLGQERLGL
jgi:hypothetical protein